MRRVLIVEDDAQTPSLLQTLLESHGWLVTSADTGAAALVKARAELPDLVISDLMMPVMDGLTLLRRWRADERLFLVPFIICTATFTTQHHAAVADEQRVVQRVAAAPQQYRTTQTAAIRTQFGNCIDCRLDARVVVSIGAWRDDLSNRNAFASRQGNAAAAITGTRKIRHDIACIRRAALAVKSVVQLLAVATQANERGA